jgi:hypothetical protein
MLAHKIEEILPPECRIPTRALAKAAVSSGVFRADEHHVCLVPKENAGRK